MIKFFGNPSKKCFTEILLIVSPLSIEVKVEVANTKFQATRVSTKTIMRAILRFNTQPDFYFVKM